MQLRIDTNNVNIYYYKNATKGTLNFAANTYDSISEWGVCGGFPLIGLCVRASSLTNDVLYYNNNLLFILFEKITFSFSGFFLIVLGFYRLVKTVVSFIPVYIFINYKGTFIYNTNKF